MKGRKIKCPHCDNEIDIELILQNIQKLEMGIAIKVMNVKKEKEKPKKKK